MQNPVEQSSAFHNVTRTATDVKENPFELRGDLAVQTLKGSPNKRSEYFSPVSGKMNQYLPGDRGLQETMWDTARDGETPQGSYMDAIAVLNGSTGGLVTGKMGSPNRGTRISSPANSVFGETQGPANERVEITEPTGEIDIFGFKAVIPGLALFQAPTIKRTVTGLPTQRVEGDTVITETPVTTTITEGESGFDKFQSDVSGSFFSGLGGIAGTDKETARLGVSIAAMQSEALTSHSPTPTNIATTFGIGEVKGLVEKPVTTTASLALGIGFGAATRGAGFAWGKAEPIVAARAGPLVARSVGFTGSKVIPAAMTTVYGVDVAARTTKGFTDFSAGSVALRSGEITSTEIAPMGAGFVGGYRSPEAIRGGLQLRKDCSRVSPDIC